MSILETIRRAVPRALLLLGLLAVPMMAMPAVNAGQGATIEAPSAQKMGAGFVLMVSIQRNQ